MNVYLVDSLTDSGSTSTIVATRNVAGSATAGGSTTYEFDITEFTGTKYVHITSDCYLYIYSIKCM